MIPKSQPSQQSKLLHLALTEAFETASMTALHRIHYKTPVRILKFDRGCPFRREGNGEGMKFTLYIFILQTCK